MTFNDLKNILLSDFPSEKLRSECNALFSLIPEFRYSYQFDQKSIWHTKDVFEHTLMVVDGVQPDYRLRLAALFHDVGKPFSMIVDDMGEGHYHGHWKKSEEIFQKYQNNFQLSESDIYLVRKLIYYHDLSIRAENLSLFQNEFSPEDMSLLFSLKKSDAMAHNEKFVPDRLSKIENAKELYYKSIYSFNGNEEKEELYSILAMLANNNVDCYKVREIGDYSTFLFVTNTYSCRIPFQYWDMFSVPELHAQSNCSYLSSFDNNKTFLK